MKFRAASVRLLPLLLIVLAVPASAQVLVGPNAEWSHWKFPGDFADDWGNTFTVGSLNFNPGVRRKISAGHGLVRAELRYAHFLNNPAENGVVLPQHAISIRLGADLLVTR